MEEILFKEEVYSIIRAAMEVYNQLGNGFLEAVYQESLAIEFNLREIPFQPQTELHIDYKGNILDHKYIPDFIAYGKIIIELKVMKQLGSNEEAQLLNYLKATGMRLGILINFGSPGKLEWKRMIK
jgi:GxxExxY protein